MSPALTATLKHGLEVVLSAAVATAIDYTLVNIIPTLHVDPTIISGLTVVLNMILKWLRTSPTTPVPDYVNNPQ